MEFKIYVIIIIYSSKVSLSKNLNETKPTEEYGGTCYIEAKKLPGRRGEIFLKNL